MTNKPYAKTVPSNVKVTKKMVVDLGYNTLHEHDIFDWKIVWNNNTSRLGVCKYRTKTIGLSQFMWDRMTDKRDMLDTILHEVAHVLAGSEAGHGRVWKSWCIRIGANPNRVNDKEIIIEDGDKKYSLYCETHGFISSYSRRPKVKRSCAQCCSYFNEKYMLKVVQNW